MERFLTRSNSIGKRPLEGPVDTSEWKIPKRTVRPSEKETSGNIKTSNRFSTLFGENSTGSSAQRFRDATTAKKKSGHIPPIFLEIKNDWTHEYIKTLVSRYTKQFHLLYKGKNRIAVISYTSESHQALKEGLRSENIAYHTFSRKDERMAKVVIFGLPDYMEDSLKEELETIGFKDTIVHKMRIATEKKATNPPFMVQLPAGSDVSRFRQIKYISNCIVQIRKYHPNNVYGTQCFRCQGFGHSSKNCNLSPRCVKCTESHLTSECPKKDRNQPAKCCNCNENHPANYRQCTERMKYLKTIQVRQEQNKEAQKNVKVTLPNKVDGRIWSNVVGANIDTSTQSPLQTNQDQATNDMLAILMTIKSIKSQFVLCNNMMDKVILIMRHLGQYV